MFIGDEGFENLPDFSGRPSGMGLRGYRGHGFNHPQSKHQPAIFGLRYCRLFKSPSGSPLFIVECQPNQCFPDSLLLPEQIPELSWAPTCLLGILEALDGANMPDSLLRSLKELGGVSAAGVPVSSLHLSVSDSSVRTLQG